MTALTALIIQAPQKPPHQATQHFAYLLVKSGGNYPLPPQGKGWCCLCTGIPGRLGKQDMKIHSFLQYRPHCLPTKNENAHTCKKKSMSGPGFWARVDSRKEHVPMGLKGGKANKETEELQPTRHSPSCIPHLLSLASHFLFYGQFSNNH